MRANTAILSALAVLCTVQAGLLTWTFMADSALADDPLSEPVLESVPPAVEPPTKLLCRVFKVDADQPQFTLPDGRTEAGQWVLENQDAWRLHEVDFEMGTKSNGYPQAWVQVCLSAR